MFARLRLALAAAAGYAVRFTAKSGRTVPGLAGAAFVAFGLYEMYRPLGFVAVGLFLLLLDRRVP